MPRYAIEIDGFQPVHKSTIEPQKYAVWYYIEGKGHPNTTLVQSKTQAEKSLAGIQKRGGVKAGIVKLKREPDKPEERKDLPSAPKDLRTHEPDRPQHLARLQHKLNRLRSEPRSRAHWRRTSAYHITITKAPRYEEVGSFWRLRRWIPPQMLRGVHIPIRYEYQGFGQKHIFDISSHWTLVEYQETVASVQKGFEKDLQKAGLARLYHNGVALPLSTAMERGYLIMIS